MFLAAVAAASTSAPEHAGGLPMAAPILFHLGPLVITNSMLVAWIVAALLIIGAQLATRKIKAVPSGAQNLAEWVVESLLSFLTDILGAALAKRTFWFLATLFVFILGLNWFGLLPGVGTIGYGEGEHWYHLEMVRPFLRGANADLNLPLAMSLVFFVLWTYWAFATNGPAGVAKHIFGSKGDFAGIVGLLMALVFLAVGVLEVISILIRPIALTFRLYGNVYGGEVMIDAMMSVVPWLSWLIPLPFYFYELLVGAVQALVFCLLCAVFIAMMCRHDDEHATEEGGHH
ncbi:MAG: F0F1 ATP synthase subunit A [Verrucomicrobium sp.]|nr:F0F1 ATP synthase subunit A [Verrucomicrobium sp.]